MFLEGVAADFAALRDDQRAWADEEIERAVWESTTADGLAGEPAHVDVRQVASRKPKRATSRRAKARRR